jgi:nitrite reductase/ring-hydroxylating ferredoxin subunit
VSLGLESLKLGKLIFGTEDSEVKDCKDVVDCTGRREFLVKAAMFAGGLVLTLSSSGSTLAGTAFEDTTVTIDDASPLKKIGGSQIVDTKAGKVIIVRTGESSFVAYSARCTHKRALLEYEADKNRFVCHTHGSIFDGADGKVLHGPADDALPSYPAKGTATSVTVSAG